MSVSDRGQCPFNSPSSAQSVIQQTSRTSQLSRPLSNSLYFSVKRYQVISALIIILFLYRAPFTIGRLIIARVINSIQCRVGRAFAQVLSKTLQPCKVAIPLNPSSTNGNTFLAIPFEMLIGWVKTSTFHRVPRLMIWGTRQSVGTQDIFAQTSATTRISSLKGRTVNSFFRPTFTSAKPFNCVALDASDAFQDEPSTKGMPRQVDKKSSIRKVRCVSILISHIERFILFKWLDLVGSLTFQPNRFTLLV